MQSLKMKEAINFQTDEQLVPFTHCTAVKAGRITSKYCTIVSLLYIKW